MHTKFFRTRLASRTRRRLTTLMLAAGTLGLGLQSVSAADSTPPTTRDPLQWPFSSTSIWNMPIGSGAVYVPANLPSVPDNASWAPMPEIEQEHLILRPDAPGTPIYYSDAGWSGASRCNATGNLVTNLPIPNDYVVPSTNTNSAAVILQSDGHTLVQMEPFARCGAGARATSMFTFKSVDLYGDGASGAHGGSGLSVLGGSLRIGDLRPGISGPRHVLKVSVFARQALYRCDKSSDCYRWPATNADGYAVGFYGSRANNGNAAVKMGALLAIPASRDLTTLGLETAPAKQLAWTLQNYGAYIVEDTYAPAFGIAAEDGPDGSMKARFKADWGFDFDQRVQSNTPWSRDIQKLVQLLHVVDNNSPNSVGGGGTPLQPLAPALR